MKLDGVKQVKAILGNDMKISEFANLHNVSEQVAKQILECLLDKPETTEEFKRYIFTAQQDGKLDAEHPKPQTKRSATFA